MRITSEQLVAWLRSEELDEGYRPQSYSGRFMYGRRCVGVVVPRGGMLRVGSDLVMAAVLTDDVQADDAVGIAEAVSALMRDARTDSMGLDTIVYWPDMEWDGDAEADEDEEEDADGDEA